jgi:hypothetical protein
MLSISSLGFSHVDLEKRKKYFLLGYFQSYRWAADPSVLLQLTNLKVIEPSRQLLDYIELAKKIKPTIIHIRLGDYTKEDGFGIVPKEYYFEALNLVASQSEVTEIWMFSDEPDVAIKYFENFSDFMVRVIPEINNSSTETLELMRYGVNYVIGNSSFSWWAAFLSHSSKKTVVAPKPWFSTIEEPKNLLPPSWLRLPIIHV